MKSIQNIADFERLLKKGEPFIVYKHSNQCVISSTACKNVEGAVASVKEGNSLIYKVDVIEQKALSNYIAEYANVKHESPQILLFEKNSWGSFSATEYVSHWLISSAYVKGIVQRVLERK